MADHEGRFVALFAMQFLEGVVMDRLRRPVVSRRIVIAGGGVLALILAISPRWLAMHRGDAIYSDTYSSVY
jgi:hypothetical protein